MLRRCAYALAAISIFSINLWAQEPKESPSSTEPPLHVPLTLKETAQHTYKPMLDVGIGSLKPLSITLDTGSVGLELFATPGIPGNGTTCTDQTFSVSYGNPLRVTYSGVICNGPISLAGVTATPSVPFGLLTTLAFCAESAHCKTPQENYAEGNYGVFGAGISPGVNLPNPLRTLKGAYGKRFMLRLNDNGPSSLVLGPAWHYDAAIFPQAAATVGALNLPIYGKGPGCVLVNGTETSVCPLISFDTGNGVPWLHVTVPNLPTVTGPNGVTFVAPGTTIGISPRLGSPSAFSLVANKSFAGKFRYVDQKSNLVNVGIEAFLGNDVIYDGEQGVITVARTRADRDHDRDK